jgi:hypothetical protein
MHILCIIYGSGLPSDVHALTPFNNQILTGNNYLLHHEGSIITPRGTYLMAIDTDENFLVQGAAELDPSELLLKQARLLAERLERLTPDSAWARRASGCRGTLIRLIVELEGGKTLSAPSVSSRDPNPTDTQALQRVLQQGFAIVHAAARERLNNARGLVSR